MGAFAHQDLPLGTLNDALRSEPDLYQNPLFTIAFALENLPRPTMELPGLTISPPPVHDKRSSLDLGLWMADEANGLIGMLDYDPSLFDAATITHLLKHYEGLLKEIVSHPDWRLLEIPLLGEKQDRDAKTTSALPVSDKFVFDL